MPALIQYFRSSPVPARAPDLPAFLSGRPWLDKMLPGLLLAAGALARLYGLLTTHSFRLYDAYHYVALAQSLGAGSYAIGNQPHTRYLPLYPLSILGCWLLGGARFDWLFAAKLSTFLASASVVPLTYALGRRLGLSRAWSLFGALLQAVAPLWVAQSAQIFSEPLFAALLLAAILAALADNYLLTGALLGLSCLTRYEGFLLLPGLALLWPRKLSAWAKFGIAFAVTLCPWLLFFLQHLGEFIAFSYPRELFLKGTPPGLAFIRNALVHLSGGVAIVGAIGLLRLAPGRRALLGGFVLGFILLHCYWPFNNIYFVVTLVPFFNLAAADLFQKIAATVRLLAPRRLGLALGLGLAAILIPMLGPEVEALAYLRQVRVDPTVEILSSLTPSQRSQPLIGFIEPLLSEFHDGPPIVEITLEDLQESPHQFVLKSYLEKNARAILWSPLGGNYVSYFGFLAKGELIEVRAAWSNKNYQITYLPSRYYRYWDREFILYRLKLEELPSAALQAGLSNPK